MENNYLQLAINKCSGTIIYGNIYLHYMLLYVYISVIFDSLKLRFLFELFTICVFCCLISSFTLIFSIFLLFDIIRNLHLVNDRLPIGEESVYRFITDLKILISLLMPSL